MRIRLVVLLSGLALLTAAPAAGRDFAVNFGGGTLFDSTRPGGHFSFEMSLSDEYPTHLAPFCEFYDDSGTRIIPVGISLLYKPPLSEYGGTIYFGAGGGALLIRGQPGPGLPTGTDGMITVAGGLSFGVGTRAGVFVQVRWFRSFEDQTAENEIGVQAGLRFFLSEG